MLDVPDFDLIFLKFVLYYGMKICDAIIVLEGDVDAAVSYGFLFQLLESTPDMFLNLWCNFLPGYPLKGLQDSLCH